MREQPLEAHVADFLKDLAHASRSKQTLHVYATDLAQFCAFYQGPVHAITAGVLQQFFTTIPAIAFH